MEKKENKICARICVEMTGRLSSPLLIGSGEDEKTDMDLLITDQGMPYIPGSALAGALRSYLERTDGAEAAEDLFGTVGWAMRTDDKKQSEGIEYQSRIYVYDVILTDSHIVRRDGVRLDEYKTSVEKEKYDMQVVETGAGYRIRLEFLIREKNIRGNEGNNLESALKRDLARIETCIFGMRRGELLLGAKSRRGFGNLEVERARYRVFKMECKKELDQWLDWQWDSENAFSNGTEWDLKQMDQKPKRLSHYFKIPLKIKNTILIRRYGMDIWGKNQNGMEIQSADYSQLTLTDGSAVIPGSTWAGAIRAYLSARVSELCGFENYEEAQEALETYFGTWNPERKQETKKASNIIIKETVIKGGHKMPMVRNAVDRFTGGSSNGALYGEIVWAGGTADLEIRWFEDRMEESEHKALCGMLLWTAFALQNGFLTVGGETGIGRGIFEKAGPVCLDGNKIDSPEQYLRAAATWCRCLKER